jgi:DNA-binding protein YbaB
MKADGSELRDLVEEVQHVRADLLAAVAAGDEATGLSGDGCATAVLAPDGSMVALTVDESVVDPDDVPRLTRAVISAVNDAHRILTERRQRNARAATEGLRSLADRMREEAARTRSGIAQTRLPAPPGARRGGAPANPS